MRKTIITVAGRTAAGKSSIAKKLSDKLGLKLLQSYTTRAPRPDESADLEHSLSLMMSLTSSRTLLQKQQSTESDTVQLWVC